MLWNNAGHAVAYCVLAGSYARHCQDQHDWLAVGAYVILAGLVMGHYFKTRKLVRKQAAGDAE